MNLWSAPLEVDRSALRSRPGLPEFRRLKPIVKSRTRSIDFKPQVAQDYLAGEPLHSLAKRHDLSRNLIPIWVRKYEAGALDEDTAACSRSMKRGLPPSSGWSANRLSNSRFEKGALKHAPRQRSGPTSAITVPVVSRSQGGCRMMGLPHSTYYDEPTALA